MSQKVEYRELNSFTEFEACFNLQKEIFNLADKDALPPVFLNLLTRKFPRTGIALGAFINTANTCKLIGYALCVNTGDKNSLYGISFGVIPEFLKMGIGKNIILALRDKASEIGITKFYCIYEALEGNLGNLYLDKLGMIGIKYEPEIYSLGKSNLPVDKILAEWDFNSVRTKQKINGTYKKESLDALLNKIPIASTKHFYTNKQIFLQIPNDFISLKNHDAESALKCRMETRELFNAYINNGKYQIVDFYTRIKNQQRENYYLLQKHS